jgi:hypothetical protein
LRTSAGFPPASPRGQYSYKHVLLAVRYHGKSGTQPLLMSDAPASLGPPARKTQPIRRRPRGLERRELTFCPGRCERDAVAMGNRPEVETARAPIVALDVS